METLLEYMDEMKMVKERRWESKTRKIDSTMIHRVISK
jgi:hypothetical protein